MINATMKITQPVDSWKKPSASSGLICVMIPVNATRLPLAMMAMGTVAKNGTTRTQIRFSKKYPYTSERKVNVPAGKAGTAIQFQRQELVAVPVLRRHVRSEEPHV